MHGRRAVTALAVVTIGFTGCGDDGNDESSATTGASAPATLD